MKFRLEKKRKTKSPTKLALAVAPWRLQIFVGLLLLGSVTLLGAITWYTTRISSLQISSVVVVGGSTIPHEVVTQTVHEALIGSYYSLIPYTFVGLYPHRRVEGQLLNIPRMKQVRVDVADQVLTVVFEEYLPSALWCGSPTTQTCYFLDAEGFAFSEAPFLTGSAFIRYIETEKVPTAKTQAFSREYMKTTASLAQRLESELNLYVAEIIRKDDIDTSYVLAGGAEIKVSNRMTADETFANLKTIFTSENFTALADGTFHYIDLRFGDKVFVSESLVATTSTTSTMATTTRE